MTQFPHDQFAKEYLKELLSPLGQVETGFEIVSEVRSVDVFFIPISAAPEYVERLGLLGNLARTAALFEPYRNPVSWDDIRKCQGKLIDVLNDWELNIGYGCSKRLSTSIQKLLIVSRGMQMKSEKCYLLFSNQLTVSGQPLMTDD
jgi:hypothetical protein